MKLTFCSTFAATALLVVFVRADDHVAAQIFPSQAQRLLEGRGPYVVAQGSSFAMLFSRRTPNGGADLFFRANPTVAEIRVNDIAGEVRDGGENGPILLHDESRRATYAVWNAADPRHPLANRLRLSRWDAANSSWSKAITINDDRTPTTHTFQTAGLAPDGSIYVVWLDRRELPVGKPADYPGGGLRTPFKLKPDSVAIYGARSQDGGHSFGKNFRIAGDVCACCRAAIAFVDEQVIVALRSVEDGHIRDISISRSSDEGKTWSEPQVASRDGWKINACPHVGPSLATVGEKVYLSWMTGATNRRGVFLAGSKDGGQTFGPAVMLSEGVHGATHPFLASKGNLAVVVFQGSTRKQEISTTNHAGHHGTHEQPADTALFVRSIRPDGSPGPLTRIANGGGSASYPFAALSRAGEIAVAWTESQGEQQTGLWVRGGISDLAKAVTSERRKQ
jgi:hypothetical protein